MIYKLLTRNLANKLNLWISTSHGIFIADVRGHSFSKEFRNWKEAHRFLKTMYKL